MSLQQVNNILLNLSKVIQKRRQQLALSQDALAAKAGLSRTYLSDVERARRNFSVTALSGIARAMGLQGSDLLKMAEQFEPAERFEPIEHDGPQNGHHDSDGNGHR